MGAGVINDVIDRDIEGMRRIRPVELIGGADKLFGPRHRSGMIDCRCDRCRCLGLWVVDRKDRAGDFIWPISGASLAAGFPGRHVDLLEISEADIFGAVDGL